MPERDGTLTAEDREKISRWLEEHWKKPWTCPISGHSAWDISTRMVYLSAFVPTEIWAQKTLTVYPEVMLVCKGCGYTMFFNAFTIGISPPPTAKLEDEKKNG